MLLDHSKWIGILGVFPVYKRNLYFCMYIILRIAMCFCCLVSTHVYFKRYLDNYEMEFGNFFFLKLASIGYELINYANLLQVVHFREPGRALYENIQRLRFAIRKSNYTREIAGFYLWIVVFIICVLHGSIGFVYEEWSISFWAFNAALTYLQLVGTALLLYDLAVIFTENNDYLSIRIRRSFASYVRNRFETQIELDSIVKCVTRMGESTGLISDFFGISIFNFVFIAFLENLFNLNWALSAMISNTRDIKDVADVILFALQILIIIVLNVSSLIMVLSCDKIEAKSNELLKHCYCLQPDVKDPILLKQLIDLTDYIKELKPKMWISGFFRVNKRLIPLMISTLASYLIIIIQFHKL
ncbi:unnamed protein product [Phyllotreta striolata]|uniref:Gustatory receptor n=1 Tax=Phyllotreta striolata TaxID=444603 RepID=A0A9N9TT29_PHYSR|nr:unnamed protein product [Phyllotreta striolata]